MTVSRRTRVTGVVLTTATGLGAVLSACSPPNEQPSHLKVDTPPRPTVVAAAELPGFIDCLGAPEHRPTQLSLTCMGADDRLVEVRWTRWESDAATGSGVRRTGEDSRRVSVELSGPVQSPQGLVFSRLSVNGEPVIL